MEEQQSEVFKERLILKLASDDRLEDLLCISASSVLISSVKLEDDFRDPRPPAVWDASPKKPKHVSQSERFQLNL